MKKKSVEKKDTKPKITQHKKPEDISLEAWQIELRKQFAAKNSFGIKPLNKKQILGDYIVSGSASKHHYKVALRGIESDWNYCSCMDFKTNQLGTCKHLEAVKLSLGDKLNENVKEKSLPYTSVYLSYKGERKVCIRIGTENQAAFKALSTKYFTKENIIKKTCIDTFSSFLEQAKAINADFRCYDDALNFVLEERQSLQRQKQLQTTYADGKVPNLLNATLYPYQEAGILFAAKAGKSIIADEMGLGKTIQAIGTAELLRKECGIASVLILCPTSLKYQWKKEIEHFTQSTVWVIEGNHLARKEQYERSEFYKIVSYNSACNDIKILKKLSADMLIMDEAQRLKNWKTQIAQAVHHIKSEYTVILSGTPLENKLEELYSIAQYIDPFCLGPYYQFMDAYRETDSSGKVIGYKNLNEIGKRLEPILIRRRKKDVSIQLPERMDKILFVPMTNEQKAMHEEFQFTVSQLVVKWRRMGFLSEKDRNRLLLNLNSMRMVCDSSNILDQHTRYDTKIEELMNILTEVFDNGDEKVVIFSQWERMTRLVAQELEKIDVKYEYLHGGIPSAKRKDLVDNFTTDGESRVFLSTDAGSTGLNLQAASIIINLDLPWNPAVLEQRIARIHRMGQKRNIQVINFVSSNTIEEQMLTTLNFKSSMFEGVLDNGEDSIFLEDSKFNKLMHTVEELTKQPTENQESIDFTEVEQSVISQTETEKPENATEEEPQFEPIETDTITEREQEQSPEELIQTGISFFKSLAKTLSTPEGTAKLVSSLIVEDKETGEKSIKIPVTDTKVVTQMLHLFGKMLG